jgi:hypothetical protein
VTRRVGLREVLEAEQHRAPLPRRVGDRSELRLERVEVELVELPAVRVVERGPWEVEDLASRCELE